MDQEKFERISQCIVHQERSKMGIGTLKEKTVHAILKEYYAPDRDMLEVPIHGYVADIFTGNEVIEIQTANFNKMRDKLSSFLPEYPVTIVYPIPYQKWLFWIDEETGECSAKRKSPVKGSVYRAFYELYKIKSFLKDSNLRLCITLLDMEEYRLLNGWSEDKKRGSCRYDRIPVKLVDEICFERREDYLQVIPYQLKEPFSVKSFAKEVHIRKEEAQLTLHILSYLELIERCGKEGRANLYQVKEIYR